MQELGRNDFNSNFGSAMLCSLRLSIFLPHFVTFPLKLKEKFLNIEMCVTFIIIRCVSDIVLCFGEIYDTRCVEFVGCVSDARGSVAI